MQFADLALSRRLERAEGSACLEFAKARRRLFPESGAEWRAMGGATVVFDEPDSPLTQTFGLGIFEELSTAVLEEIEGFYAERGAPVHHEVSPFAGVAGLSLLCSRGYRPIETSSVLYQQVAPPGEREGQNIRVRLAREAEAPLWADVSARGWTHEHPELLDFLLNIGAIASAREENLCFLAEIDGEPGAAATLCVHEGVALFAGSATVPALRGRGLQGALIQERMRYAFEHGCDLAMIVTEVGSRSQRNAERNGFRIAYTRTKWQLFS